MRPKDKVVAAPIVLRIGEVPVFALPFYFKSLKEGRQSGILFPTFDFGWSSREGRYIRDFGYYWATNDYIDLLVRGRLQRTARNRFPASSNRYVKRYAFNGGVDYSRQRGPGRGRRLPRVAAALEPQPAQSAGRLQVPRRRQAGQRSSAATTWPASSDRDIVSGQLKSNVYLSRNWSFMNASLNASRDERVNAEDNDPATDNLIYSMTLPSLSLSFRAVHPGAGPARRPARRLLGERAAQHLFPAELLASQRPPGLRAARRGDDQRARASGR